MKKIGEFISNARLSQGISLDSLSKETRIKTEFLEYIEKEQWERLPELPVLLGFIKNIALALNIPRDQAVALLRRDYPPKKLSLNPKPDIKHGWSLGPKTIFAIFISVLLLSLGGYLLYQYQLFVSPPRLTIVSPSDNEVVTTRTLTVRGTTDTTAVVRVNNQPANVDEDGRFTSEIEVIPETKSIEIVSTSRSGKITTIHRTITVTPKK